MSLSFLRLLALFLILSAPALAQQGNGGSASPPVDVLSATSLPADAAPYDNQPTHPAINLTPDKSELVRLDRDAGTVIVGNPLHLSVLMDSEKGVVLVGKAPGATYFTVLDDSGNVIMQRHVIVAAPKEHYIRVRRSCAGTDKGNCQETSVFYCPDMCHNVNIATEPTSPTQAPMAESLENMTDATAGGQQPGAPAVPPAPVEPAN